MVHILIAKLLLAKSRDSSTVNKVGRWMLKFNSR